MTLRRVPSKSIESPTGLSFYYVRRVSSVPTPDFGDLYGQTWEPAGEYMTPVEGPRDKNSLLPVGTLGGATGRTWYEHGRVHFRHPFVLRQGEGGDGLIAWKRALSLHFQGKTGARLSAALRRQGYDGVVVLDPTGQDPEEVVNLCGSKTVAQAFPKEAQRFVGPRRLRRKR